MSSTYDYRGLFLLHFEPRYQHAQHYLGYAKRDIRAYAKAVIDGREFAPQALVAAAVGSGVEITIANVWPGWDRNDRRKMRRAGSLSRFCSVCRESGNYHR